MKRTEAQKVTLEAFRKGPTHAVQSSLDDVKRNVLSMNLVLFGQTVIETAKSSKDEGLLTNYEDQRIMAKIYTDMILGMLKDFIDCSERGELDEPIQS